MLKDFVSVAIAARKLRCSRSTVLRLIESGDLTGARLTPRGWFRVSSDSLERKLTKCAECVTDCGDSGIK